MYEFDRSAFPAEWNIGYFTDNEYIEFRHQWCLVVDGIKFYVVASEQDTIGETMEDINKAVIAGFNRKITEVSHSLSKLKDIDKGNESSVY